VTGLDTLLSTSGGTSDGRFIAPTGCEVVELGPCNATIHQIDECVAVADLEPLALTYQRVLEHVLRPESLALADRFMIRTLVILFLLVAVFAVVFAPAALLRQALPAGADVALTGLTGTLWKGDGTCCSTAMLPGTWPGDSSPSQFCKECSAIISN
jgi:hypothetical protein